MANEKPIVYVVQEDRKKNILSAMDFGELEAILGPQENVLLNSARTVLAMEAKLYRYRECDFILPIGDPAAIGIACALAAKATGGVFRVLKWDRQEGRYYPIKIDLNARA